MGKKLGFEEIHCKGINQSWKNVQEFLLMQVIQKLETVNAVFVIMRNGFRRLNGEDNGLTMKNLYFIDF